MYKVIYGMIGFFLPIFLFWVAGYDDIFSRHPLTALMLVFSITLIPAGISFADR